MEVGLTQSDWRVLKWRKRTNKNSVGFSDPDYAPSGCIQSCKSPSIKNPCAMASRSKSDNSQFMWDKSPNSRIRSTWSVGDIAPFLSAPGCRRVSSGEGPEVGQSPGIQRLMSLSRVYLALPAAAYRRFCSFNMPRQKSSDWNASESLPFCATIRA